MLAEVRSAPRRQRHRLATDRRAAAGRARAPRRVTPGSRTANSSPPSRATSPVASSLEPSPVTVSRRSPALWPRVSLTSLKSSRSSSSTAPLVAVACMAASTASLKPAGSRPVSGSCSASCARSSATSRSRSTARALSRATAAWAASVSKIVGPRCRRSPPRTPVDDQQHRHRPDHRAQRDREAVPGPSAARSAADVRPSRAR